MGAERRKDWVLKLQEWFDNEGITVEPTVEYIGLDNTRQTTLNVQVGSGREARVNGEHRFVIPIKTNVKAGLLYPSSLSEARKLNEAVRRIELSGNPIFDIVPKDTDPRYPALYIRESGLAQLELFRLDSPNLFEEVRKNLQSLGRGNELPKLSEGRVA